MSWTFRVAEGGQNLVNEIFTWAESPLLFEKVAPINRRHAAQCSRSQNLDHQWKCPSFSATTTATVRSPLEGRYSQ